MSQQIPLSAASVWGPCAVNEAFLVATADGKLHYVNSELTKISVDSPIPCGKPQVESDGIVFTSSTGLLWKMGISGMKTLFSHETGVAILGRPTRYESWYIICGKDGSIVRVETQNGQ